MKDLEKLKEKLWDEVSEISRKPELGAGDLDIVHKLTDTIKNIDKICALEEDGMYSNRMYSGRHYVRGHYSNADNYDRGYAMEDGRRRSDNGRYSRDGGRDEMMRHLSAAMSSGDESDREMIRRMMDQMQR